MPNPLIKKIATQAGVKKAKVEKVWNELKEEYGENYEAIVGSLKKAFGYKKAKASDARFKTPFNHLKVEDCVLTAESVDSYLGKELPQRDGIDPEKIYNVYRPLAELKKAVDTYNEVPLVNEHYFVDGNVTNKDKWLGTSGSHATIKDGKLYNSIAIWDKDGVDLAEKVKKGLSCGYSYNLVDEKGEFNGKPYDFKMTDIVCNHVALVGSPRVQVARLADSLMNILIKGNDDMSAKEILSILMQKNPQLVTDAAEEYEKKEKEAIDKKKAKDDTYREKSGGAMSTDESEEEEEEEMKDKKKAKDKKKMKDKKKGKDEEECVEKKEMAGDSVEELVKKQLTAYNIAKDICEKAIGKTTFAADAMPEQMYNATLKALNIKCDGYSMDTKAALIQYISDSKAASKQQKQVIVADSQIGNDINIIEL